MSEDKKHFSLFGMLAFLAFLSFLAFLIWQAQKQAQTTITTADIEKAREIIRRLEEHG